MFKIVNFKNKNVKELPAQKVCLDFALAEFSSAIEMLQASKKVENTKLANWSFSDIVLTSIVTQIFLKA